MYLTKEQIEEKFDEKFPKEPGLFNTQSGWLIKADPNVVKSFIHSIRENDEGEVVRLIENLEITGRNMFEGDDAEEKVGLMQELYTRGIKPVLLKELTLTQETK